MESMLMEAISVADIKNNQRKQRREKIIFPWTSVPAGMAGSPQYTVLIQSTGPAWIQRIGGSYSRLSIPSGGTLVEDDGICHLRIQLSDSKGSGQLFSAPISLCNMLSPGGV